MLKPESSRIIHVPLTETVCQAICSVFTASLHSNQCSLLLCGIVHFFLAAFCLLCVHLILSLSYVVLACGYCGYEFVGYCFLNNALHFILPSPLEYQYSVQLELLLLHTKQWIFGL